LVQLNHPQLGAEGSESVDWQSTLVPVIPAKAGIQAVFELKLKTNLDTGVRRHDEFFTPPEGTGFKRSPRGGTLNTLRNTLRRYGLEFEACLPPGKVKHLDRPRIVYVLLARELVETRQTNNFVLIFGWYNFPPNFIRNVEIELILTFTHPASLSLKTAPIASPIRYPHRDASYVSFILHRGSRLSNDHTTRGNH
jgi:hypothetical protein